MSSHDLNDFFKTTWAPTVVEMYNPSVNVVADYLEELSSQIEHLEVHEVNISLLFFILRDYA